MVVTWYPLRGRSMWPLAAPMQAGVVQVVWSELQIGDVIAFVGDRPGTVWLHRVVAIAADHLSTRGDTNASVDTIVPASAVLGRLQALQLGVVCIALPTSGRSAAALRQLGRGWGRIAPSLRRLLRGARKC